MNIVRSLTVPFLLSLSLLASGQQPSSLNGTATYRERMALPPGAVFEATLEDVSRADAPAVIVNSFRKENPGNPPFAFSIAYDPKQIVETHTYAVRASVTLDGKLFFTSTQRNQVLTQGHGSDLGTPILMQRVATNQPGPQPASAQSTAADEPLRETYWKLIELNGKPVTASDNQREAGLTFHTQDHRVTGSGGCNRLSGSYMVDGDALHFKGVASTMMACLHGMDTEQQFLGALNKVESWKISGKHLELYGSDQARLARFEAVALK